MGPLTNQNTSNYTRDQVHQLVDSLLDAFGADHSAEKLDNSKTLQGYAQRLTLTVQEAANQIGVSKPVMYRLLEDGEIHAIRIGRKILIPLEAVTDYLRGA